MPHKPAFEIVCLGAGGGPLEGDVLGYMCKPYASRWDQGWIGLEGGCGIGALTALLHQAILTKALRQLHQASVHNSPALSAETVTPQPEPQEAERLGLQELPLPTPPTSAHVAVSSIDIRNTVNSRPPALVQNLGTSGREGVHVEEGTLFPGLTWPDDYQTPVLKAAWLFSHLTSYLITHAHFDHTLSLVLATGSLPNPSTPPATDNPAEIDRTCPSAHSARRPVYASLDTLEKLQKVYQGDIWPELGCWSDRFPADDRVRNTKEDFHLTQTGSVASRSGFSGAGTIKWPSVAPFGSKSAHHVEIPKMRRRSSLLSSISETVKGKGRHRRQQSLEEHTAQADTSHNKTADGVQPAYDLKPGVGVQYCPTPMYPQMQRLPMRLAGCGVTGNNLEMTVLELPISHGSTTQGNYQASAFFIRVTESQRAGPNAHSESNSKFAEILFFGDMESSYTGDFAQALNIKVWKEAAERWAKGTLRAIFIECSYVGSRPKHLMFGHLAPPCLMDELNIMASFLPRGNMPPLQGLAVYIQHVKEPLVPEEPIKQKITKELEALEAEYKLGVQFMCLVRGMRITI
ncbi:hypothetical protein QFC22_002221 [Naganishia vaughanmartiniae]|uniref:Uncharacterized protein n=1 Tax=Naganishia vaughanmartiniae TaxID=1424756 RepID=A0ACC2XEA5_9TREE|nr:hypothetical protein QFC22_002221 [Naganishia vaughanmartiniae]